MQVEILECLHKFLGAPNLDASHRLFFPSIENCDKILAICLQSLYRNLKEPLYETTNRG